MVGDITYIPTWEGWLYLATVIDCATRKVVGWAMNDHYRTPLITSAIERAAQNLDLPAGAVFHSDRGSNYTSAEFAAVLDRLGIQQSVGRTGVCFDNSLAESFNAAVKVERVHRTVYPTREKAKKAFPQLLSCGLQIGSADLLAHAGHRTQSRRTRIGGSPRGHSRVPAAAARSPGAGSATSDRSRIPTDCL